MRYRVGSDPDEPFTLWRGDKIGKELTGMNCRLQDVDAEQAVFDSLFIKYPNLRTVVTRHVRGSEDAPYKSPYISLTSSFQIAEMFSEDSSETIYEITLPASKLVADPPTKSEKEPVELLAIGRVEPIEITGIARTDQSEVTSSVIWDRSMSWAV